MSHLLYSVQDGVRNNYFKEVMREKLNTSQDNYNSQNKTLDQLDLYDYDIWNVGYCFIAYLVNEVGINAYINGFYRDLDTLSFNEAFEENFKNTKDQYLVDFNEFFKQSIEIIMSYFDYDNIASNFLKNR